MAVEFTLAIIKPDVVKANKVGEVISMIEQSGFEIVRMRMMQLTRVRASEFYQMHCDQPYFAPLIDFMISGDCVALALKREDAVVKFRALLGATKPANAAEGTIRKRFGTVDGGPANAAHGSDSVANGVLEIMYIFDVDNRIQ